MDKLTLLTLLAMAGAYVVISRSDHNTVYRKAWPGLVLVVVIMMSAISLPMPAKLLQAVLGFLMIWLYWPAFRNMVLEMRRRMQ